MKRRLLLFALLTLLATLAMAQTETPDECAARLDANVRVDTIAEAIDWLARVMSECVPVETPATEAADETPATETADDQCTMMYLWDNGYGWGWIRSGTNPADAAERVGKLYVGDSICTTGDVVEWVGKDTGDWQEVIYEGEVAYVFNQWLRDRPQAPRETTVPTVMPGDPPQQTVAQQTVAQQTAPQQTAPQPSGADNYYFEGRGATETSPFPMVAGKWHWRLRSAGDAVGVLRQQGDGSCMVLRGVNTGGIRFWNPSSGFSSFEVRYPCDVSLEITVSRPSDATWKVWVDKVEN